MSTDFDLNNKLSLILRKVLVYSRDLNQIVSFVNSAPANKSYVWSILKVDYENILMEKSGPEK